MFAISSMVSTQSSPADDGLGHCPDLVPIPGSVTPGSEEPWPMPAEPMTLLKLRHMLSDWRSTSSRLPSQWWLLIKKCLLSPLSLQCKSHSPPGSAGAPSPKTSRLSQTPSSSPASNSAKPCTVHSISHTHTHIIRIRLIAYQSFANPGHPKIVSRAVTC